MNLDIYPFESFFSALADAGGLTIEVWDRNRLVYSTRNEGRQPDLSSEIGSFSSRVTGNQSVQFTTGQNGHIIGGIPLRGGDEIIGALIIHTETDRGKPSFATASETGRARIERLLAGIAGIMEEKWNSRRESEKMVEELTQNLGELYLYSRISTQVKTLPYSGNMLKSLLEELLETMRVDIAFSLFPDQPDHNYLFFNKQLSAKIISPPAFVKTMIDLIPGDVISLKEDYFIINNSCLNPEYRQLHPDPFRFLAVVIRHDKTVFGWLGLVSFNMKEIFRQGELQLLKSLGYTTAVSLENMLLYQESVQIAQKERSIRHVFQKYVPEEVVNDILDRGERDLFRLGEKRWVTLLNVDIRGYSRMSKTLRAEETVTILNHFFMIMGGAIISHRGILDKYLGDGILAIFGAPVAAENHALDATLAAIDMVKHLDAVNEFTMIGFGIPLHIGISIHTGEVILGNIGFEKKMEYTVIGDVVNDTFRLQELTREKPNSILISKSTQEEVKSSIVTRKLGVMTLRINESEMEVFEVIG